MAATPPAGDRERELDDVMAKIDKALPELHRQARETSSGTTPTQGFAPARIKRTRMAFKAMCEDSLLNEPAQASPEMKPPITERLKRHFLA